MQMIEDGTTEHGLLIWELQDDTAAVEPVKKFDKAHQAIDAITMADKYKSSPGEYWIPILRQFGVPPGQEEFQTRAEWIEKMQREESDR